MGLTAGTRLGQYEIVAPLGAGGMGDVYRARDTRLNRDVAVKVLPDLFASDPDRVARFEREALTLAALNHPNIAQVYGVVDQPAALVMELVDGEDLSAIIARHAHVAQDQGRSGSARIAEPASAGLDMAYALGIASQIAEALAAAHERGIVHRDLKPANVKVREDGTVKVLDFGLAKALAPQGGTASADAMNSPTLTLRGTQLGMVMGTAAYMAPEQARGKDVDRRADVWAFGAVLYEMLTGRRAFDGTEVSDILASVLRDAPPLDALPAGTHPAIVRLLRHCLEKDRAKRLDSMAAARLEIEEALSGRAEAPAITQRPTPRRPRWPVVVGGVLLVAVAVGMTQAWLRRSQPSPAPAVVFNVSVPAQEATFGGESTVSTFTYPAPAVSPDGRRIGFIAHGAAGQALFIRTLDSLGVQQVKGTAGIRSFFWSHDGGTIAFFAGDKLRTVELATGKLDVLCDAPAGFGGSWGPDGTILFSPDERSPIFRISAEGGTPTPVTTLDPARGDQAHRWPQWLADGRHFIFMPWTDSQTTREIQLASIDGGPTRTLFKAKSAAVAARDYFFYVTDMPPRLSAQAYDPASFALIGQPFAAVADTNVDFDWLSGLASVSVAADTLVYTTGKFRTSQLTLVDRGGHKIEKIGEPAPEFDPRLSRDGSRVALEKNDSAAGSGDIWTIDLSRQVWSRLTSAPGFESTPVWSPDGQRVAFASDQGSRPAIYVRSASGTSDERTLLTPPARSFLTDWSADGRHILMMLNGGRTRTDLWQFDVDKNAASPLLATPFNEGWGTFSPDGRWIAYVSDEDQRRQVYVRSYPGEAVKIKVSTDGGSSPQWRGDGRELFYMAPDNTLMAVAVQGSAMRFAASPPGPLFTATVDQNKSIRNQYAVTSDGQRFLIVSALDMDVSPLVAVLNWRSMVKR